MIHRPIILLLLALAVSGTIPAHAGTRYRHMTTIRAAVQLCKRARVDQQYRIAVVGFFRRGPENNGPDPMNGALFDSDTVAKDAAVHTSKYHGVLFATDMRRKLVGSIDGITRPHARVAVHGVLYCSSFPIPGSMPFLQPNVIAVSKPSRSH